MKMVPMWQLFLVTGIVGIVVGALFFALGMAYRKKIAEMKIGSAEDEARKLINDAIKTAEQKRKEALLEAKDEALKLRSEADKEIKDRRAEVTRQERRLDQKEENIDKKTEALEKKEEDLAKRNELMDARLGEIEQIKERELQKLETVSGLSKEAAKDLLLTRLDEELTHEKAVKITSFEANLKEEQDDLAREYITEAIARCAADHASEETATGVDLIIDDTPEAITVSSFDAVRREVARRAIEKLIQDGRIHPARIEEMVEKSQREVDQVMKKEGEKAVMEVGLHNLHPEITKLLGRLHYRTSYGQNVLKHSMEVAFLSGLLAGELGVDVTMARRAGLLHDIGKALDHQMEGSHVQLGAEVAKKYKENPTVINAIEAHHGDVEPKSAIAFIVMAADAISAGRPGARRENLENYIKRLEKLEEISLSFEGVEQSYAIQAGREIRIMVRPDAISEDQMVILASDIAKKIEEELEYPGQIKVNVIRENRAIDYAK